MSASASLFGALSLCEYQSTLISKDHHLHHKINIVQLLEVAARAAAPDTMIKQPEPQLTPKAADKSSSAASSPVSKNTQSQSPSRRSAKVLKKPWIPLKNGECQFKCCQNCRPSLNERSYLSINGIVNNDFPLTAITGFGFHLQKARPVADVKHVRNLGLRPNPEPVGHAIFFWSLR